MSMAGSSSPQTYLCKFNETDSMTYLSDRERSSPRRLSFSVSLENLVQNMERSGKRKENDYLGKPNVKRLQKDEGGGGEIEEKREPTGEEVEEFFAILRRMQTAKNHFRRFEAHLTERWRLALGIDRPVEEDKEEGTEGEDHKSPEESGQLDLNEVPVEFENTNDGSMIGKPSRAE